MPTIDTSFLFATLDNDSLLYLVSLCSYPTLCRLRSTCKTADTLVAAEMEHRYSTSLRAFFDNQCGFRDMLNQTGSVVSGSFAVKIASGHRFRPGDLDVYSARGSADRIVSYLEVAAGYTVLGEIPHLDPLDGTYIGDIERIIRLSRQGLFLDVVVSLTFSAMLPIVYFWSTVPMIYFGGDGLCISYPQLLEKSRGLINPRRMETGVDEESVLRLRKKYEERGFEIQFEEEQWVKPGERVPACKRQRSPNCPLTMRFFGDRFCLLSSFKTVSSRAASPPFTGSLVTLTNIWWRGGSGCGSPCNAFGTSRFRALTQKAEIVGL